MTPRRERRDYSRTGINSLKAKVKVRGMAAIDRRTTAAKALLQWRQKLIDDLGGPEVISAQKEVLVDICVRSKLFLDSLDAWIMEQKSLVNARKRAVLPVVRERTQIADSLARILIQLGLERRSQAIPTIQAYLKRSEPAVNGPERGPNPTSPVPARRGKEVRKRPALYPPDQPS